MNDILFELNIRLNNNISKQNEIEKSIVFLPKGHVNKLYRNNRGYYYLTYREDNKIKNDYLGPENKFDLNPIFNRLKQREIAEKTLKELRSEEKKLRKLIKIAK